MSEDLEDWLFPAIGGIIVGLVVVAAVLLLRAGLIAMGVL